MPTYRLRPELFNQTRRKLILIPTVTLVTAAAIGGTLITLSTGFHVSTLITAIVVTAAILGIQLRTTFKKFRAAYQSFEIELGDSWVERRGGTLPALKLSRDQITGINEVQRKGMVISTAQRFVSLPIPYQLEHYDDLRAQIAAWKDIDRQVRVEWYYNPFWVGGLSIVLAMAAFLPGVHRLVVSVGAVGLLIFFSFGLYQAQVSPNCPPRAKTASKWGLVLVLVALVRLWLVWTT